MRAFGPSLLSLRGTELTLEKRLLSLPSTKGKSEENEGVSLSAAEIAHAPGDTALESARPHQRDFWAEVEQRESMALRSWRGNRLRSQRFPPDVTRERAKEPLALSLSLEPLYYYTIE